MRARLALFPAIECGLQVHTSAAQEMSGALIGTVEDTQGGVIRGAPVRVSSPALISSSLTSITNERGQLRFPALPPGSYVLEIGATGFRPYREEGIRVGVGLTIERRVILAVAGLDQSAVVEAGGSRVEARGSGFETRL